MIHAREALALDTAQLTEQELKDADEFEAKIEEAIRSSVKYCGVNLTTSVTNANVIAAVHQRLAKAGWRAEWRANIEQHPLNKAVSTHTGFAVSLIPRDESYNTLSS